MSSYYYLASPYKADTPEVMEQRKQECARITSELYNKERKVVFSPIQHNWQMVPHLPEFKGYETFRHFDETMITHSAGVLVLMLDGWQESYGISEEMKFCKFHNKLVWLLNPVTFELRQLHAPGFSFNDLGHMNWSFLD